jgi:hypothetical protein
LSAALIGTAIHRILTGKKGVIIEHPDIAGYFKEVFEDDWQPIRLKASQNLDYLKITGQVAIILCLAVVFILRQKRM